MKIRLLNKENLKNYIENNRLVEVIKSLIFRCNEFLANNSNDYDFEPIKNIYNALIINSGRYTGLNHDKSIGILDFKDQIDSETEIKTAILEILDRLPKHFWEYCPSDNNHSINSQFVEKVELYHSKLNSYKYDIFICFSSKDRETAKPLWEILRGYGLSVFVSDEDLLKTVGSNFVKTIYEEMSKCKHFLFIASYSALKSVYVEDEYTYFYNRFNTKKPVERRIFVYKPSNFEIEDLPHFLSNKQIATSVEQIIMTLVYEINQQISNNEKYKADEIQTGNIEKQVLINNNFQKNDFNNFLSIPIGKISNSEYFFELGDKSQNYHAIVSGRAGSGKTNLLQNIITQIAENYTANQIQLFIIDYMFGVEYHLFKNHPCINKMFISNSNFKNSIKIVEYLNTQLTIRSQLFKNHMVKSIFEFNERFKNKLPFLIVIIDNIQEIYHQDNKEYKKAFNSFFSDFTRLGRTFGLHLILSSQSFIDLSSDIISQIKLRIVFKQHQSDLRTILNDDNTISKLQHYSAIFNENYGLKEDSKIIVIDYCDRELIPDRINNAIISRTLKPEIIDDRT